MRSPWQILKGFAVRSKADGSPRHPYEPEDVDGAGREDAWAPESKPQQSLPELTSSDTTTVSVPVTISAEEPPQLVQERLAADDGHGSVSLAKVSSAHEDAPMPQLLNVLASPTPMALTSSKVADLGDNKAHAEPTRRSGKKSNKAALLDYDADRSNEIAVIDQAIELETEINALRAHLSEKLKAQNIHLRLLLERYGR